MIKLENVNQKLKGSANSQPLEHVKNSHPVYKTVQQLISESSPILKSAFQKVLVYAISKTVESLLKKSTVSAVYKTAQQSRPLIKQFNSQGHSSNSSSVKATYQTVKQSRPLIK